MSSFNAVQFIRTRRVALREHTDEEIAWWIDSYTKKQIPDYQMSAWLMAVCLRGLSARETATLTRCMVQSGVQIQWNEPDTYLVDKHSSGGIGDKVSIILTPLVATFDGIAVPMMAGRGLGHTGGTIDKLESIPGFRTDLTVAEFQQTVRSVGCVISTSGPTLCPADRLMYALRDVTDTVTSLPLQTASIMCKKIAEHPDSLVLDVKYGRGAFQADAAAAEKLAASMVATGEANGLCPTTAFLTRMNHPIGRAVGNWLEVKECVQIMRSGGNDSELSRDLIALVTCQAGQMLLQSGRFPGQSLEDLVQAARERLDSGAVLDKFVEMVTAQGGDASVVIQPDSYPFSATHHGAVVATQSGFIADIDALAVGAVAVELGAGRRVAGEDVDPCAGIWFHVQVGDSVEAGTTMLADVYTNRDSDVLAGCIQRLQEAIKYTKEAVQVPPIITHRVTKDGTEQVKLQL